MNRLHSNDFNVILLDLVLPDSSGLATFTRTYRKAPEVPIVVLSGNDDGTIAFNAIQQGAQDYLVKSQLKAGMLARALLFATQKALSGSDSLDLEEYVLGLDAIVRSGESEETQRDQALTATNNLRSILNDMLYHFRKLVVHSTASFSLAERLFAPSMHNELLEMVLQGLRPRLDL